MNECNLLVSLAAVLKAIISKQNYLAVKKLIYFSLCNPFCCLWKLVKNYNNHALPSTLLLLPLLYPIIVLPLFTPFLIICRTTATKLT